MSERIDLHDLNPNPAVPEERMKAMDGRHGKGWALLREDNVRRGTRHLLAVAGLIPFGAVILGTLIRWPG